MVSLEQGTNNIDLDSISHLTRSGASVPLNPDGSVNKNLAEIFIERKYGSNAPAILNAALTAAAINSADPYLYYDQNKFPNGETHSRVVDISEMQFVPELFTSAEIPIPNHEETMMSIMALTELVENDLKGGRFYSPVFRENSVSAQIEITEQVRALVNDITTDFENYKSPDYAGDLLLYDTPIPSTVVTSIARLHLIPTQLVGNTSPSNATEADFDSGMCDRIGRSSVNYGEHLYALAQDNGFTFVRSNEAAGWARKEDIALDTINLTDYKRYLYAGSNPLFYNEGKGKYQIFLPGDKGFVFVPQDQQIYKIIQGTGRSLMYQPLSFIKDTDFIPQFNNPNHMIQAVSKWNVPYMHSIMDCSNLIKRALSGINIDIPKSTSAQVAFFRHIFPDQTPLSHPSELNNLTDGLYLSYFVNPATDRTSHGGFYIKKGENAVFISQAFQIPKLNGEMVEMETPVGLHIAGNDSIAVGLKENSRSLAMFRIAQ